MPFVSLFFAYYFLILGNALAYAGVPINRRYLQIVFFLVSISLFISIFKKLSLKEIKLALKKFGTYFVISIALASFSFLNLVDYSLHINSIVNLLSACFFLSTFLVAMRVDRTMRSEITNKHIFVIFILGLLTALTAYLHGPFKELDAQIDFMGSSILLGSFSVIAIFSIHIYFFHQKWRYQLLSIVYALPFYYLMFLSTSRGAICIYLFIFIIFLIKSIYFCFKERAPKYLLRFVIIACVFILSFASIFTRSTYYPYYVANQENASLHVDQRSMEFLLRYSRFLRFVNDYISDQTREQIRLYLESKAVIQDRDRLESGLGINLNVSDERMNMYGEFFTKGVPFIGYWPKEYKFYTDIECGGGIGKCEHPHNLFIESYYNFGFLFFVFSFFIIMSANLTAAYNVIKSRSTMSQSTSIAIIVISLLSMYTAKYYDYLTYIPIYILFAYFKDQQLPFLETVTNLKQSFLKNVVVKIYRSIAAKNL